MIDKKFIVSLLVKATSGQKKKFVKQTIHPRREWFIGLLLFVVLVAVGGAFSAYNFVRYTALHVTLPGSTPTVEMYKENTVKKALQIYTEKQKTFSGSFERIQTPQVVVDTIETPAETPTVVETPEETLPVVEAAAEEETPIEATEETEVPSGPFEQAP